MKSPRPARYAAWPRDAPPRPPSRPRLRLRHVFTVVVAALAFCAWRVGQLFVIAWLPCLIESASRLALEGLLFSDPPSLPEWLLSQDFEPPTWLTAFVVTPWAAMAWAFVLRAMSDRNSPRGMLAMPAFPWVRFEFSPAIFMAAAIFSAANFIDGALRFAERRLLRLTDPEMSDASFATLSLLTVVFHIAAMAVVMAWSYPLAGSVLRTGKLNVGSMWRLLRGNTAQLTAIFFLLTVALAGLDWLLGPLKAWLVHLLTAPPSRTEAAIRYVVDFPLSMLMIVVWAVTVGIILDALAGAECPRGSRY